MTDEQTSDFYTTSKLGRWVTRPGFWFVVALVVRLLYLLEQGGTSPLFYQPLLDEKEAYDSARAVINGQIEQEPYFKAPGYAWIMAPVLWLSGDAWPWTLRMLQHLAGALLVYMAAWLGGRISPADGWRRVAVAVSGFLATFYAPLIRLENNISLDFWVVFFQSGMICALAASMSRYNVSKRWALAAGALAAAAWITRPTITIALPFMAIWLAVMIGRYRGSLQRQICSTVYVTAIFLAPVIVTMASVLLRNATVSGEAMVMPWQGGYNLYYANNAKATGRYLLQDRIIETEHANPTRHLAVNGYLAALSPVERQQFLLAPVYRHVNRYWFSKTIEDVSRDPGRWFSLMFRKGAYLFSDKEIYNYEDFDLQRSRSGLLWWMPGRFGVVFPLALASLALPLLGRRRSIYRLLWLYVLSLGGAIAVYYVSGRMRMPVAFPMVALAGYCAAGFFRVKPHRKTIAALLLAAGVIIAWGDWWGVRSESMAHADLARMSNAAWHRGHYGQAMELALEAERLAPGYPTLPRLKAQALYGLNRYTESLAEFERSAKVLGDETSRRNAEVIREELGIATNAGDATN